MGGWVDFKVSNDVGSGGGGKLAEEGGDAEGRAGMQRRVGMQRGGQGCRGEGRDA